MYHSGGGEPARCTYLDCKTTKYAFRCSGVKSCEFLNEELRNLSHCHADEELFDTIFRVRDIYTRELDFNSREQEAFA
jgi:hypothetical protein